MGVHHAVNRVKETTETLVILLERVKETAYASSSSFWFQLTAGKGGL